ncbi:MAG TPA: TIGR04283 family arsenosugar biosynthesis glycosyltransferase [Thermoanaerobaculia bacterium]|jgi:rSAM/selenodomain-associated transferase 2|nr:TIGR04283 family arsenosugar biosynthesis glycosyltransferase [Thermoanaerobaculia bacterium]
MSAEIAPMISIIVPIKNEAPEAVERFRALAAAPGVEILVADAGSCSATTEAFRAIGARIVEGPGPRGARLAGAAREARGEILFFLHSDSEPPGNALEAVEKSLTNGAVAGSFSLAYRDANAAMRWIAWWANFRSRRMGLPFGDQGLFCRRDAYEKAGGFAPLPICDDVDLVRRLKRVGRLTIRPEKAVTSARRYRQRGALRQVLRNWRVLAGYFLGVNPETLERWYNGR